MASQKPEYWYGAEDDVNCSIERYRTALKLIAGGGE